MIIANNFFKYLVSSCLLILSFNSQATLINSGSFITDTDTGYDWLDLNQTVGYSYDAVVTNLGAGGVFDGWTLATFGDVHALLDAAGGDGTYTDGGAGSTAYLALIGSWGEGVHYLSSPGDEMWFHVSDVGPGGYTSGALFYATGEYEEHPDRFSTASYAYPFMGVALTRATSPSSVPEPTTIALMGLGLASIGWRRKVKAKR